VDVVRAAEGGPRAEVGEPDLDRAAVEVAERPGGVPKEGTDRDVEEAATRMVGDAAEEVRPQHRGQERPVAAGRLPLDAAMSRLRARAIALVDPRHELVAEVGVVAAGRR
jgi:hypothetical protein